LAHPYIRSVSDEGHTAAFVALSTQSAVSVELPHTSHSNLTADSTFYVMLYYSFQLYLETCIILKVL